VDPDIAGVILFGRLEKGNTPHLFPSENSPVEGGGTPVSGRTGVHHEGPEPSPDLRRNLPLEEGCQNYIGFVKLRRLHHQVRVNVQLHRDLVTPLPKLTEYPLGQGVESTAQEQDSHRIIIG